MKRLPPRLALVLPCFNEEEVLTYSDNTLSSLLDQLVEGNLVAEDSFILYVDDGSRDRTWPLIQSFCAANAHTAGVTLAANTGQQNSILAGLEFAAPMADAVITLDADLQDDINVIPDMLRLYADGYDVIYGVRDNRDSDTRFKRNSAQIFYRTSRLLGVNTVYNHADFRLLSARAVADLLRFDERNIYLRGMIPLLGYRQTEVYYARRPRSAGATKYPLKKAVNLAIDGITSFSVKPIRLVAAVGIIFLIIASAVLIYTLIRYFNGKTIEGWTSLILSVWFCSGVILIALGVVGEYIGKIYTEVKHRPRYSVKDNIPPKNIINDTHYND